MRDEHGDRMKVYERTGTSDMLMPGLPIFARIDGKTFSTYTKGMKRPFDICMTKSMISVTEFLVEKMVADVGYTQSDEITLMWCNDNMRSDMPFGGRRFKMIGFGAAWASVKFAEFANKYWPEKPEAIFDCRVWQVPNRMEAANTFLWRVKDAEKNSTSMAASELYSPKELHGKNGKERQQMILAKNINWNAYPESFKRGTFVRRLKQLRNLSLQEFQRIPEEHRPVGPVERTDVITESMPPFGKVANRAEVLFEGTEPRLIVEV